MSEQNADQLELIPTVKERAKPVALKVYEQRGLLDEAGELDRIMLADLVLQLVLTAVVTSPRERSKIAITRPQYMAQLFPEVPGQSAWFEQDDPELAEEVYNQIDTAVWRLLDVAPNGPIQSRLNGDHALVLCVLKPQPRQPAAVYVTRNPACIVDDVQGPANRSLERASTRAAALAMLAIERVPEHGSKFGSTYNAAARLALATGKAKVQSALEASKNGVESDDGDE